jgi:ABC-type polysaccharide/polyol phosphate export permease
MTSTAAYARAKSDIERASQTNTAVYARAKSDIERAFRQAVIWNALALVDIRSKYRFSTFGSLWITLTTGSMAVAIGLFYGQFFGMDVQSYLPYFTTGFIVWTFISGVANESATALIATGNMIKSSQMPIIFYILRMLQKHFIIFLHNLIVIVLVWLYFRWDFSAYALLSIPGLVLCYLFLVGISVVTAIVCVRYRDIPPLVGVATQFVFFATPIMWHPESLQTAGFLLHINPAAYLLIVVRDPILGRPIDLQFWIGSVLATIVVLTAAVMIYTRYRHRIAYWV